MEKPDYLPFNGLDEITTEKALETNVYIAELEASEHRSLSRREIYEILTGEYFGATFETNQQTKIIKKVGHLANNLVVAPRYKKREEITCFYIDVLKSL